MNVPRIDDMKKGQVLRNTWSGNFYLIVGEDGPYMSVLRLGHQFNRRAGIRTQNTRILKDNSNVETASLTDYVRVA